MCAVWHSFIDNTSKKKWTNQWMQQYNLTGNFKQKSDEMQEQNGNGMEKVRLELYYYTVWG